MERGRTVWITSRFEGLELPPIAVLDIPEEHEGMDPALQEMLRPMLDPEIEHLIAARDAE
jgi:predicted protein tyrosine phosphatase